MSAAPAPTRWAMTLKRRAFATPLDDAISIAVLILLALLFWTALDWALLRAVFRAEDVEFCKAPEAGACWSIIDARHRLILFGLYPFDEHWRSTLAAIAIIATVVMSCIPWFWPARRLIVL